MEAQVYPKKPAHLTSFLRRSKKRNCGEEGLIKDLTEKKQAQLDAAKWQTCAEFFHIKSLKPVFQKYLHYEVKITQFPGWTFKHLKVFFFSGLVSSSSGVDHCLKDAALEGAQAVCKPQGENPQNGWGLNSGLNPLFFNGWFGGKTHYFRSAIHVMILLSLW